jgi:hypothetical protein
MARRSRDYENQVVVLTGASAALGRGSSRTFRSAYRASKAALDSLGESFWPANEPAAHR